MLHERAIVRVEDMIMIVNPHRGIRTASVHIRTVRSAASGKDGLRLVPVASGTAGQSRAEMVPQTDSILTARPGAGLATVPVYVGDCKTVTVNVE